MERLDRAANEYADKVVGLTSRIKSEFAEGFHQGASPAIRLDGRRLSDAAWGVYALLLALAMLIAISLLSQRASSTPTIETPAEHPGAAAAAGERNISPRSSGATFDRAREPALDTSGAALGGSGITAEARVRQSRGRQSPIGTPEPPTPKPEARPPGPIRDPEPETRHPL